MLSLSLHWLKVQAPVLLDGSWQVVPLVREKLLFLAPADPRLPGTAAEYARVRLL